jgi:ribosome-associated protein
MSCLIRVPPDQPLPMLRITDTVFLADWELSESFIRASGPGGQNVNKVSTAVELRFEAERSPHLAPDVKARLKRLAGRRWTLEGALIVTAERHRTQALIRAEARE